jgi:HlyD family secretion protein
MQGIEHNRPPWIPPLSFRGKAIAAVVLVGMGGAVAYGWQRVATEPEIPDPVMVPVIPTVTALGRLEPRGTVVQLSAPTSAQGNRVEQLLVQAGDRVQVGQVIAILDAYDQRRAALAEAEEQVKVAQARLAVVQAGAKQGEVRAQQAEIDRLVAERQGNIEAQAATVARLQAEVQNAQAEFERYESLYREGAISVSERDRRRLALATADAALQEAQVNLNRLQSVTPPELSRARATLEQIAEVRPVDLQVAQAEVDRAIALRNQAQASLDQSLVRSPLSGEVLEIHTRPGEVVSTDGIADLGQTQHMQVVAEVYQSDIQRVQVGQQARITSDSIGGELTGVVTRIGSQVRRQNVINTDPSANIDARVIEVDIDLDSDSSERAAKFTHLQVQVVIEP